MAKQARSVKIAYAAAELLGKEILITQKSKKTPLRGKLKNINEDGLLVRSGSKNCKIEYVDIKEIAEVNKVDFNKDLSGVSLPPRRTPKKLNSQSSKTNKP